VTRNFASRHFPHSLHVVYNSRRQMVVEN